MISSQEQTTQPEQAPNQRYAIYFPGTEKIDGESLGSVFQFYTKHFQNKGASSTARDPATAVRSVIFRKIRERQASEDCGRFIATTLKKSSEEGLAHYAFEYPKVCKLDDGIVTGRDRSISEQGFIASEMAERFGGDETQYLDAALQAVRDQ